DFKLIKPGEVRVRLAPSPTGPFHIGTARAALFNCLFAKKHQGSFILRIEDTDIERSDSSFEKDILENLKWLGMEWDEGPAPISQREIGEIQNPLSRKRKFSRNLKSKIQNYRKNYIGDYGPYRQSERTEIYKKYLEKLLSENKAYYCFCSEEELEEQRQYQMSIGQPSIYNGKCKDLPPETVKKYLAEGKPSIIRFKCPFKKLEFNDLIRGKIAFETSLIGDFAIAKPLTTFQGKNLDKHQDLQKVVGGYTPLYNFAVVIDDFEMKISHVIRGEDHISNTPKQILIQEALDFTRPEYAHLPLILGPDRSKLSKRHGATSVLEYRKMGYLPEALVNLIAFLGWNPGTEREIYSLASLIKEFSLEKVQKGGAIFNIKRLDFLNGFYIRQRSVEKLTELCLPYLIESGLIEPIFETKERVPDLTGYFGREIIQKYLVKETGEKIELDRIKKIISIHQERLKKLSEISELTDFFFKKELEYNKDLLRWGSMTNEEIRASLTQLEKILSKIEVGEWNKENLTELLMLKTEEMKSRGELLWPLRIALTGKKASAGPFEIAEILGKEKTLARIKEARELLK
ncbi:glutamate--tRNA ligase, partial [Patescibacteria group bacterium]|nr:glutamate--tRNA ligase [Patescibacteria group bacterium]